MKLVYIVRILRITTGIYLEVGSTIREHAMLQRVRLLVMFGHINANS